MQQIFKKISLLKTTVFAVVIFFAVAGFVQAQTFIEPSEEAPKNNVLDFISESGESQSRLGKLRIGSSAIPNQSADPMVDVIGNTYFQGNAYFDRQVTPAWQVIQNQAPQHVNSGTVVTNGKLTIQHTAGPALYANSLKSNAIYVKTLSESAKAIFGQTIQVAGGSVSSGVRGEATNELGAGIYARQNHCPGSDIAVCGNAAQFIGNVVVTGVIRGDGRGIVRTWTLNDASTPLNVARGISVKTIDIVNADFDASSPRQYATADVLPSSTTFITMSVMVGESPYDPTRALLDTTNEKYLAISYDTSSNTLNVKKGSADENLIILFYYHQELSAQILDGAGNIVNPARALVGTLTPLTFRGSIGGGQFEGGEFLWTLHTDPSATDANICTTCGSVAESGPTTTYIPPATIPASGNSTWLKATWAADPTIYSIQQIDLYSITITPQVIQYVLIGGQTLSFSATVSCPPGECLTNPITWSVQPSSWSGSINETTGIYTSPAAIDSGSSWTSTVRAAIALHPELYKQKSFTLLPQILISAQVNETEIASPDGKKASIGVSQTVVLRATAVGIPAPLANDFNWSLQAPSGSGATLTGGSGTNQTAATQPTITYTAPSTVGFPGRTVVATWRSSSGATLSNQSIQIYPGAANNITFTQTEGTTGAKSLPVLGFQSERRIYSFCTTLDCTNEQVVDYTALAAGTPYVIGGGLTGDCGTVSLTGPATSNPSCNPDTQICSLNSTFSYTASGTGLCTLKAKLLGDTRQTVIITLDPTSSGGGCTCNPKTGYCCVDNGDIPSAGGSF